MATSTETLERQLANDLQSLGDMVADDSFYEELYRSLSRTAWAREGGHVALSFKRAEELVNEVRAKHGREPLALAQTGGEGEVSDRVRDALATTGWSPMPLKTDRHDDAHVTSDEDPPPSEDTRR